LRVLGLDAGVLELRELDAWLELREHTKATARGTTRGTWEPSRGTWEPELSCRTPSQVSGWCSAEGPGEGVEGLRAGGVAGLLAGGDRHAGARGHRVPKGHRAQTP